MDFFPDGSGRFAQRSWPLCSYVIIIYSEPSCHIQRENLLIVWPGPILIFFFSFLPCTVSPALLVFCLAFCAKPLCSAASLCLTQRTSSPSKPSPSCLQCQSSSLVGLIPVRPPWSSLRSAWSCPRGKDLKAAPGDPTSRYCWRGSGGALSVLCHPCHPQGQWVPWASSLKCAPRLRLVPRFSHPYGPCAASDCANPGHRD